MPKRSVGLVTGMLSELRRQPRQSSKPRKPRRGPATLPARRVIKTVRVDPATWETFRRYILGRQAKGETVEMGQAVEAAITAYMGRRGPG